MFGDAAAQRVREPVWRVLEEPATHELRGLRIEARVGPPYEALACRLQTVPFDGVGELAGNRGEASPRARAGRKGRQHEPAYALRMGEREAQCGPGAHR